MTIKLIAGLGNPGKKYEHNRHNAGFRVVDALAEKYNAGFIDEARFKSQTSAFDSPPREGARLGEVRVILCKPQTFMNESGQAVAAVKNFFKIDNTNILIVHDDVDLPFGKARLSFDASSAGHNGVKSIIERVGQDFHRLRIGIEGRQSRLDIDTHDYVLQNFTLEEANKIKSEIIPAALSEVDKFLHFDF